MAKSFYRETIWRIEACNKEIVAIESERKQSFKYRLVKTNTNLTVCVYSEKTKLMTQTKYTIESFSDTMHHISADFA